CVPHGGIEVTLVLLLFVKKRGNCRKELHLMQQSSVKRQTAIKKRAAWPSFLVGGAVRVIRGSTV
ncbi:MAG: hypothetical protein KA263_05455, partial [Aeromonas sp.]|nr:hypothetical protein [Aeromonas sp.]